MIKKMLSLVCTIALVLALGASLDDWQSEGVSLASPREAAIAFGRK